MDRINVTTERADEILEAARKLLVEHLTNPYMRYTDDPGDYLSAALDNFHRLADAAQDGDPTEEVNRFLNEPVDEWLACDGEIRFDLPETAEAVRKWEEDTYYTNGDLASPPQ